MSIKYTVGWLVVFGLAVSMAVAEEPILVPGQRGHQMDTYGSLLDDRNWLCMVQSVHHICPEGQTYSCEALDCVPRPPTAQEQIDEILAEEPEETVPRDKYDYPTNCKLDDKFAVWFSDPTGEIYCLPSSDTWNMEHLVIPQQAYKNIPQLDDELDLIRARLDQCEERLDTIQGVGQFEYLSVESVDVLTLPHQAD